MSKAIERKVKKSAKALDVLIHNLAKSNKGKFVLYYDEQYFVVSSFEEGVKLGAKKFGLSSGFVVREIGGNPHILSSFVKKI